MATKTPALKLTTHQQRILAALLELERRHTVRWWNRYSIGLVVGEGGCHDVIQKRTMLRLSELSLVLLEVESWPKETRQRVSCNCAAYAWGLSDAGRAVAEALQIRWPKDAETRLAEARYHTHHGDDDAEGQTRRGDRWVSPRLASDIDDDDHDPADFWKRP